MADVSPTEASSPGRIEPNPQPRAIDISDLNGLNVSIATEHPLKLEASLDKEAKDASFQRWTKLIFELGGFLFAVVSLVALLVLALAILRAPTSSPDDKKWATAVVMAVASAATAFVLGRQSK